MLALNRVVLFLNLGLNVVWVCFQCAFVILLIHVFVIRLDFVLYWYLFPSVTGLYVCRARIYVYLFMLYAHFLVAIQFFSYIPSMEWSNHTPYCS